MSGQAAELARHLARHAEAVCRYYLPNGRRNGRYWLVGDVHDTPGRSLYVRLAGPQSGPGAAGKWSDAATGEHGDLIDLIAANRGLGRFRDACHEARHFLSLPPAFAGAGAVPPAPRNSPEAARRLFRAGVPIIGTRAEAYLRTRGITGRLDWPSLRFHAALWYRRDDKAPRESWPGLLAAVTDPEAGLPDSIAPGSTARVPTRRLSPIRAARSAICSATACVSAPRKGGAARRRRHRDRALTQIACCPACP